MLLCINLEIFHRGTVFICSLVLFLHCKYAVSVVSYKTRLKKPQCIQRLVVKIKTYMYAKVECLKVY